MNATAADIDVEKATHRLIARVSDEYERWSYNTAVAAFMEFVNLLSKYVQPTTDRGPRRSAFAVDQMLLLLAPMAPHMTAELWERRRRRPRPRAGLARRPTPPCSTVDTVTMVVQVNGKVRDRVEVAADITAEQAEAVALALPKVQAILDGAAPRRVIARPPNLVNVVV